MRASHDPKDYLPCGRTYSVASRLLAVRPRPNAKPTLEQLEDRCVPTAGFVAQVEFGPTGIVPPNGYVADTGALFNAAKGYGWNETNTLGSGNRGAVNANPLLDSFIYSQSPATWTYDLANGQYLISLASGDPSSTQGPQQVVVNGVTAVNDVTTGANQFATVSNLPVTVSNGQLNVTIGGGGGNTMLDYLTIQPGSTAPAAPTNVSAGFGNDQVVLRWTASAGATSYNIYRGTSSGGETLVDSGFTGTGFTDKGLTGGTTYYYEVLRRQFRRPKRDVQ